MKQEVITSDITVVSGGLAGVNAAVAAARLGRIVSLIQNRLVLGGNSSSEVRVWVCGLPPTERTVMREKPVLWEKLFLENQYCNIDGNLYIWDMVVLETVRASPISACF
jgi:glycine/D-amino acid oxidase-like deaminating enzyme